MEEIIYMIFHGFKQVKELESSLPKFADHQQLETLSKSLDHIVGTFGAANERLKIMLRDDNNKMAVSGPDQAHHRSEPLLMQIDPSLMQEYWLSCGVTQTMDVMVQTQPVAEKTPSETEGFARLQRLEVTNSGKGDASSTSQRPRRRKDGEEVETVLVAAPRMGNIDIPPDDNYTWRKYGQKEILGSTFPRAYYRCTHQKLYNCPAKKQVQRLDHDPYTFRVTYRGTHTCHISATAPISTAGASTVRYAKDVDYPMVAYMADAMFNSGSSNDIDFIFHSDDHHHHHHHHEDKKEPGDKRN